MVEAGLYAGDLEGGKLDTEHLIPPLKIRWLCDFPEFSNFPFTKVIYRVSCQIGQSSYIDKFHRL